MRRVLRQLASAVALVSAWEVARLTKKEIKRTLKKRRKRRAKRSEKEDQDRYPDTWGFSGSQLAKGDDFPERDYADA